MNKYIKSRGKEGKEGKGRKGGREGGREGGEREENNWEKNNKVKSWFFKMIHKIGKPTARLAKKK